VTEITRLIENTKKNMGIKRKHQGRERGINIVIENIEHINEVTYLGHQQSYVQKLSIEGVS
jgi:hypothetical protein